jgi:serine/threonine protein kinase
MRGHPTNFDIGERASGTDWVVESKLGERPTGATYAVTNASGVHGAMKVVLPGSALPTGVVARLLHEMQLLAALRHPNIVRILDFGQLTNGTPFVVMERLQGRTLRSALRTMRDGAGLTASLAYEIIRQLSEGLHCAHSHVPPIVHGDVRPENIFVHLAPGDAVVLKLFDFGVRAILEGGDGRLALGTPHYMAPELFLDNPVSAQSDVYAVAILLYQMLTDRFPWEVDIHTNSAIANAHLKLDPVPPSRHASWIPSPVDECIMQALVKDPKARPSTMTEFCAALCVLQFIDDSSKDAVDADATPTTRLRDVARLLALADAVRGPGAGESSPHLVTPPPPNHERRRSVVTSTVVTASLVVALLGAAVLAHPTGNASRAAAPPPAPPTVPPAAREPAPIEQVSAAPAFSATAVPPLPDASLSRATVRAPARFERKSSDGLPALPAVSATAAASSSSTADAASSSSAAVLPAAPSAHGEHVDTAFLPEEP